LKRFEYKVPGGKLIRAKVDVVDGSIKFLQLTGDFFMQPETDLEELEKELIDKEVDVATVHHIVVDFFGERHTVIAGASASDFAYVILQAIKA
jgi:hypothetical protein